MGERIIVAQLSIERQGEAGYLLRHVEDVGGVEGLELIGVDELQSRTQYNSLGMFRPLHSAPDLCRGWYCRVGTPAELEQALEAVYPGFLADWHAVRTGPPPVTDYYAFTQRQSGMYRLTAKATPEQAAAMVQSCCAPRFCLKQRYWGVPGLAVDRPEDKSLIPCLEPCALLLEFARKRMRISQETPVTLALAPTEIRGLLAAVERLLNQPNPELRVADFSAPANPRHVQFLQQKLMAALPQGSPGGASAAAQEEE
ncbi:MAG: DR2241 family protein [Verrucomicrobiae bacterium]|nr:DR2241 family protein [Verrucomicrobiae bacterium]